MLHLNIQGLRDESGWQAAHIALPRYDVSAMQERTLAHPTWIHFGAGNIFRAFLGGGPADPFERRSYRHRHRGGGVPQFPRRCGKLCSL